MSKISVALATYNEEENIARCLESVKDLADEVVIYDGESKDKTVEIAKTFGAKIIVGKNYQVFHVNKQKAIDQCRGDWILQLDADEVVSSSLAHEIRTKISDSAKVSPGKQEPNSKENGYWVPRKNYFLGRFLMKGGQYPDYTLRLYRKGKGKLPQKDVHEQAVVEGQVGYLSHALLHYPYKNFSTYLFKWNRYCDLISVQLKNKISKRSVLSTKITYFFGYLFIKPIYWFLVTYFRHKGFMDSWQGFVFSFFSALRFPVSYIKYLEKYNSKPRSAGAAIAEPGDGVSPRSCFG